MVAEAVAGGQLATDMPEFLEVMGGRALRGLDPERRVAARPALPLEMIFALRILGKREELPRFFLGLLDQLVGDAVVGDDGEAKFLETPAQLFGKGVGVAVGLDQADRSDMVVGNRA